MLISFFLFVSFFHSNLLISFFHFFFFLKWKICSLLPQVRYLEAHPLDMSHIRSLFLVSCMFLKLWYVLDWLPLLSSASSKQKATKKEKKTKRLVVLLWHQPVLECKAFVFFLFNPRCFYVLFFLFHRAVGRSFLGNCGSLLSFSLLPSLLFYISVFAFIFCLQTAMTTDSFHITWLSLLPLSAYSLLQAVSSYSRLCWLTFTEHPACSYAEKRIHKQRASTSKTFA